MRHLGAKSYFQYLKNWSKKSDRTIVLTRQLDYGGTMSFFTYGLLKQKISHRLVKVAGISSEKSECIESDILKGLSNDERKSLETLKKSIPKPAIFPTTNYRSYSELGRYWKKSHPSTNQPLKRISYQEAAVFGFDLKRWPRNSSKVVQKYDDRIRKEIESLTCANHFENKKPSNERS